MSETERGICPECGTEQLVNRDGTLRKHGTCEPGQRPVTPEPTGEPDDRPDADDWDDDDPAPDTQDDETPPAEGDQTPAAQGSGDGERPREDDLGPARDAYRWELTIAQPAIYLEDPAWHSANSQLAAQEAAEAGHVPTGEAKCISVAATEDGAGLTLTYDVPIET